MYLHDWIRLAINIVLRRDSRVYEMPPKRKKVVQEPSEASDLSPPPDDLLNGEQAVAGANGQAEDERPAKKRRTKQTTKVETEVEVGDGVAKPARKWVAKQKVKVDVEGEDLEETGDDVAPKKGLSLIHI